MFPAPDSSLQSLLEALAKTPPPKKYAFRQSPAVEILKQIATLGQIASLPYLQAWIHCPVEQVRSVAEETVAKLLTMLEVPQILALEAFMRKSRSGFYEYDFNAQSPESWMLSTMGKDGRKREEAIKLLITTQDTKALPFILLRTNDWVHQVRDAAEEWLSLHARYVSVKQLISCTPIFAVLKERQYANASPCVEDLISRLSIPESIAQLEKDPFAKDARTRELIFDLLTKNGSLEKPDFQKRLLNHPNPVFGLSLLRYFRLAKLPLSDVLADAALASKSATIQRHTWYLLTTEQFQHLKPLLMNALYSSTPALRSFARYHVRKSMPSHDLQELYQKQILVPGIKSKLLTASIHGFHETDGKWDASVYEELLTHKSSVVRIAALRGFVTAVPEEAILYAKRLVASEENTLVTKNALLILKNHIMSISIQEILKLLDDKNHVVIRHRGLELIKRKGKWEMLPHLLRLTRDSSSTLQSQAALEVHRWLGKYNNNYSIQPSRLQLDAAKQELKFDDLGLSPETRLYFDYLLASTKAV